MLFDCGSLKGKWLIEDLFSMKYDAIVNQGIPIHERVPIPERLIPEDSRVEIDAKIYAGYFTNEKIPTIEELSQVRGRAWYVYYPVVLSSLVFDFEIVRHFLYGNYSSAYRIRPRMRSLCLREVVLTFRNLCREDVDH